MLFAADNDALPLYKESIKVFKRLQTKVYCGTLSLVGQERETRTSYVIYIYIL